MAQGRRSMGRRVIAVAIALVVSPGCAAQPPAPEPPSAPVSAEPTAAAPPALAAALARSRAAGSAQTVTTLPPGVLPTTRISGVVDFTTQRSETLIEIHRDDGVVLPYGRVVRTIDAAYHGQYLAGTGQPHWRRFETNEYAPPTFDGLLALAELERQMAGMRAETGDGRTYVVRRRPASSSTSVTGPGLLLLTARIGADGRIAEVTLQVPSVQAMDPFRMTFSAYGEPVRITVPAV